MRIDFDKDELNLISECIYLAVCDDEMSSQLLKCLDLNQAKLNRISISVREKLQHALKKTEN